jgi:hypothetical protein
MNQSGKKLTNDIIFQYSKVKPIAMSPGGLIHVAQWNYWKPVSFPMFPTYSIKKLFTRPFYSLLYQLLIDFYPNDVKVSFSWVPYYLLWAKVADCWNICWFPSSKQPAHYEKLYRSLQISFCRSVFGSSFLLCGSGSSLKYQRDPDPVKMWVRIYSRSRLLQNEISVPLTIKKLTMSHSKGTESDNMRQQQVYL